MSGYVGRGISYGNASVDQFTGNGGATYSLSYDTTTDGIVVSLDGVVQKNGTDFNVTGTSLVFTSTVANPIAIQVIYTGLTLSIGTPGDGTVTDAKIDNSAAIATSKISGAVTSIASHGLGTSATVDTGTSANQIVKLDGSAKIPAVDGSQLTNLPSPVLSGSSNPTVSTNPSGGVGTLYVNTETGSIYACKDATTNANIWYHHEKDLGSISSLVPITATGGTITTSGAYKYHTFTSSGTFTVSNIGSDSKIDYLIVAGGGAGAAGYYGGGGGAGGYRYITDVTVTATSYTVTVGGGGSAGSDNQNGGSGSNSVFNTTTSSGGGGGSGYSSGNGGVSGGSGGGGCGTTWNNAHLAGSGNAGSYSPVEGYNGGAGSNAGSGGGGGGASEVGSDGTAGSNIGGAGGDGLQWVNGTYYAGGGGGGAYSSVTSGMSDGGLGGGGKGADWGSGTTTPEAGTVNTGGGGGGNSDSSGAGGAGGSGIVIVRYKIEAV